MNKYVKFLSLALFAVLTISFVACSDDNDEPDGGNGGGGGSSKNYTFTANGTTYYYGVQIVKGTPWDLGSWWESSWGDDKYICLSIDAYSKRLTYDEIMDWDQGYIDDVNYIDLTLYLKHFDVKKAKKGDLLELWGLDDDGGVRYPWPDLVFIDRRVSWWNGWNNIHYYWTKTPNDKVTFVSYKNGILTINIESLTFLPERSRDEVPNQFKVRGTISFERSSF